MFCSKCGSQNNPGEIFCKQCGTMLGNNNQQAQFAQPQQNLNNNQQVNSNYNQQLNNNNEQMNNNYSQPSININSQNINNGTYKLTLTRPKKFVGSLIKYTIFIDNRAVGTIKNGETIVLNVSSGNHIISFNKTMNQNINISSDTLADVVLITANKYGLSNIRNSNGLNIQNNELYTQNADKIIKSAKNSLIFSCSCIVITFILLFIVQMVVSPWVYGISIGYTIINLLSAKKYKQTLNDKYGSLIRLNIASIVISIVGLIISVYLMTG